MANRLIPSLPRVKVPIGHIPQRLRSQLFENPRGRLEVLRRFVNQMVREERVEFKYNKAVECRQYLERVNFLMKIYNFISGEVIFCE